MKRRPKKQGAFEKAAKDRFKEIVLVNPCLWTETRTAHKCSGIKQAHHTPEAQFRKFHFMPLKKTDPEEFWAIVHDPLLGVALCEGAHEPVTNHSDYVYFDELPVSHVARARELGILWRLEMECPEHDRTLPSHLLFRPGVS